uniref:Sodium-dependent phosphate transport protein 2A n=1 Tax=Ascaris lumbricoides TaxID=6252 RepID=A0A0M3HYY7_ASCLU
MLQLRGVYGIDEAELLLGELFAAMDAGEPPSESGERSGGYREHVPDWAFIVIIASILLSALAFYIGTCINKRTTLRAFNGSNTKSATNRRSWGAGFSGGIWAAA